MKQNDITNKLSLYLEGSLSNGDKIDVENQLKNSETLRKELEELNSFLNILNSEKMETPSANLQLSFDKMLAQEIENQQPKVVQLKPKTDWKQFLRIAASIVIVLSAFLLGKYQSNESKVNNNQNQVLALLENNSASKRIEAVISTEDFSIKDTKILKALINRLFFDKNTNVRLAAAEALSKFSEEKMVRDAFIKSLETDKNPTIQLEVIQILSDIQEKRAIKPMEKMLDNEETPQYVKQQLKLNLSSLL
ncbi:HEAT repeat domain-containing protein [Polaribacter porphyrae]|uniref:Anti-sigma factor n=1 Tax=Polaribacter porphyrae TaxID=1137780 RepID=A0A2S7WPX5_9FLAO|nr:HEAT repeat domain-containing protein [Polaribacter porphyrae]PQJ79657.1 hypothetical protein BTO18_10950 [Polaribacter porphyrae]